MDLIYKEKNVSFEKLLKFVNIYIKKLKKGYF